MKTQTQMQMVEVPVKTTAQLYFIPTRFGKQMKAQVYVCGKMRFEAKGDTDDVVQLAAAFVRENYELLPED